MKKIFLACLLLPTFCFSQTWQWAKKFGGAAGEGGKEIVSDPKTGDVLLTGYFGDVVNFGCATYSTQPMYDADIMVGRYDSLGNCKWIKEGGGPNYEMGNDIDIDQLGNCYLTGYCSGLSKFDSVFIPSNNSARIFFLAKYDSIGALKWFVYDSLSVAGYAYATAMVTDSAGNTWVTGFNNWNLALGSHSITSSAGNNIFMAKFDPQGNCLWLKSMGNNYDDQATDIAVDGSGNVLISGNFKDTLTIGSYTFACGGLWDGFVVKFDSTCTNVLWAKQIGTNGTDHVSKMKTDKTGNTYLIGDYANVMPMGSYTLPYTGGTEGFVCKIDPNGNVIWAKMVDGSYGLEFADIELGVTGSLFLAGNYWDSISIVPITSVTSGYTDFFIAKMDTSGGIHWIKNTGAPWNDYLRGIALNAQDECLATGEYSGPISFDNTTLPATNNGTAFYARLGNSILSIDEKEEMKLQIAAYPNPFSEETHIRINGLKSNLNNLEITLFNTLGEQIHMPAVMTADGFTIHRDVLTPGIYFLQVISENGMAGTGKIIVN